MASGIYRITNTATLKVYIGSAVNIEKRWGDHRRDLAAGSHHSRYLQRAHDKHGASMFAFEVLEVVGEKSQLLAREQHWINATQCFLPGVGYNICAVAGNTLGVRFTDEAKAKISAKAQGRTMRPETIAKIVAKNTGRTRSAETKLKISAALVGKTHSAERIEKVRAGNLGKKRSDESKAKQGAATRGRPRPADVKARIAASHIGKKHSPETIEKLRQIARARHTPRP